MNKMIFTISLTLLCFSVATDKPSLQALYDQHRWFELRDAIKGQQAPPLYTGAVASAFNDPQAAEKYFNETIKLNPASDGAADARDMLADRARRKKPVRVVREITRPNDGPTWLSWE